MIRSGSFARLGPGRLFPIIDRGSYWQAAVTMAKGSYGALRSAGIAALRADLDRWLPFPADRIDAAVRSWDDTGFLEVRVNRLRRWHRPGLLCIGDAAHAMSPIAGVGINLAIQDAVAAANQLVDSLAVRGTVTDTDLAAVQRRRALPAILTQQIQLLVQRQLISGSADPNRPVHLPRGLSILSQDRSTAPPVLPLPGPRRTQRAHRHAGRCPEIDPDGPAQVAVPHDRAARRGSAPGRLVRRVHGGGSGRRPDRPSGLGRRDLPQRARVGARAARGTSVDRRAGRASTGADPTLSPPASAPTTRSCSAPTSVT